MNLDEMKKLYESEPDKWVVYHRYSGNHEWEKLSFVPRFNENEKNYKLIHKNHEVIADAIIANPDVEVEKWDCFDRWEADTKFFQDYNSDMEYQLKPQKQDFNGGYIKASQEAYDLLIEVEIINLPDFLPKQKLPTGFNIITIDHKRDINFSNLIPTRFKQFYINNGALSWDEPNPDVYIDGENIGQATDEFMEMIKEDEPIQTSSKEDLDNLPLSSDSEEIKGEEDETNKTNKTELERPMDRDTNSNETINIADEDGKVYEFEKPEFECELLKIFAHRDKRDLDLIIALIWDDKPCEKGAVDGHEALLYTLDGKACDEPYKTSGRYNLTPIQKKWYENEDNFPMVLMSDKNLLMIVHDKDSHILYNEKHDGEFKFHDLYSKNRYRLATKQELNSLYYEGKES